MSNSVFITGYSLICSLGNTEAQIIKNVKKIDSDEYETILNENAQQDCLYKIKVEYKTATERFYGVISEAIDEAIKASKLNTKEQGTLEIFIGSTSMKISVEEEDFVNLGYGAIGEFVVEKLKAKKGYQIFSTACTSSANAFAYAAKKIKHKKIERALVIGLEFFNKSTKQGFESLLLLSKKNIYRPFDSKSDGVILGEGCSAVVLDSKRLNSDSVEYLGSANTCDNYSETTSDMSGAAVFDCLSMALQDAEINLENIDIIKAHGTGTENNNIAEAAGIQKFLAEISKPACVLKPYLGHTLGASGTNEIALLLLCIKQGFIPSARGFEYNEDIDLVPLRESLSVKSPLNILFNYMGFGGNNTAIILRTS